MTIEALDVLCVPSRDVAADLAFYRDVLGARVVFAIEAMGTRVAEVAISLQGRGWCSPSTWPVTRRYCCIAS